MSVHQHMFWGYLKHTRMNVIFTVPILTNLHNISYYQTGDTVQKGTHMTWKIYLSYTRKYLMKG